MRIAIASKAATIIFLGFIRFGASASTLQENDEGLQKYRGDVLTLDEDEDGMVELLVQVDVSASENAVDNVLEAVNGCGGYIEEYLTRVGIMEVKIPIDEVEYIQQTDGVKRVENNFLVYPTERGDTRRFLKLQATQDYGVNMVQANASYTFTSFTRRPQSASSTTDACSSSESFKVAIIDSGVDADHRDSPCHNYIHNVNDSTNCIGKIFPDSPSETWHRSTTNHGMHLFGIIGAVDQPFSMNPDSQSVGICYMFGRVFNKDGSGIRLGKVFEAVEWALENRAKVINMSLSGIYSSSIGQEYFDNIHAAGAITVASAGNTNKEEYRLPAAHRHVLSVTGVDANKALYSSSTINDMVDIAAPGVNTFSLGLDNTYTTKSGSSMATAFVTGGITKIWSVCRRCSNKIVVDCLLATAEEVGGVAYSKKFGHGIMKVHDAYRCLVSDGCCRPRY